MKEEMKNENALKFQLQNVSAESLISELASRQCVSVSEITEDEIYAFRSENDVRPRVHGVGNGPASVLIVTSPSKPS